MELSDKLVLRTRARRPRPMAPRERRVVGGLALLFLVAGAIVLFTVPPGRDADIAVLVLLVLAFAAVSSIEFEIANGYAVPTQLVLVPMLFLAPVNAVPLLVAAAYLVADAPRFIRGGTHPDRLLHAFSNALPTLAPAAIIGLLAAGPPRLDALGIYALAFAAQAAGEIGFGLIRDRVGHAVPAGESVRAAGWSSLIDLSLAPVALLATVAAESAPLVLLAIGPLALLLHAFSRERERRYTAASELNHAYRGTVILLADVLEAADGYTADHCRSVVELASAVGEEIGLDADARQELEFVALLHDVGKISMPTAVLHKPTGLDPKEVALMETHTIAAEALLARVGGELGHIGELVRSTHERWDGSGYPDGLAGEEIPLAARIVFCCDAFNAMTTDRPYRAAMCPTRALEELRRESGGQFDPRVVEAVASLLAQGELPRVPASALLDALSSRPLPQRLDPAT